MSVTVIKLHRNNNVRDFYTVVENITCWAPVGEGSLLFVVGGDQFGVIETPDEIFTMIVRAKAGLPL